MSSTTEVHFGGAQARAVADDMAGDKVKLTRYNSLENNSDRPMSHTDESKSISVADFPAVEQEQHASKWPWAGAQSKKAPSLQHSDPGSSSNGSSGKIFKGNQPFQVVWRDLAFEVDLPIYDRLFGGKSLVEKVQKCMPFTSKQDHNQLAKISAAQDLESSFSLHSQTSNGQKRVIFRNLNGYIRSGEITAILGPSGAGKTSLLNAICGKPDHYSGTIQLNGGGCIRYGESKDITAKTFMKYNRIRTSIIPQRDHLIENLTVRENLYYASKILNPAKDFNHEANILRVVKMLNLINCLDSRTAQISGGEYKRVSIAQELLKQPDILILDEPTSGLDSLNCKNLIKALKQLIENSNLGIIRPIAIVMTIHQPDIEIFHMFDHVYCMARHGKVIFDGHPSDTVDVIKQHADIPLASDAREDLSLANRQAALINPANLLIEIASENMYGLEAIERLSSHQLKQFESQAYPMECSQSLMNQLTQQSNNKGEPTKAIVNFSPSSSAEFSSTSKSASLTSGSSYLFNHHQKLSASLNRDKRLMPKFDHTGLFWHHSSLLAKRAFLATFRDPLMTMIVMIFHLTIPFVMWMVYSQKIGKVTGCPVILREMDLISLMSNQTMSLLADLQDDVHTTFECSTMFFVTTYCFSVVSLTIAAIAFPLNMHILLKEVRNGWYSLSSYVVAKTISNIPFEVLSPVVSIVMIYVLLQMPSSYMEWRLCLVALVMALVSMISHTQGLFFGALCMNSLQSSIFLSTCSSLPLVVLSGFTARIKLMPWMLQKLSLFSLYRYSSDAINIIRFGYGNCPCDSTTSEYLSNTQATFTDIPSNIKPLFNYYLVNTAPSPTTTAPALNETSLLESIGGNATRLLVANATSNRLDSSQAIIPGIDHRISLSAVERAEMLSRIESDQLDIFSKMAELVSRSFAFGAKIESCKSARSEILVRSGTPDDEALPMLIAGLFAILIGVKIILFIAVKYKIRSKL